MKIQEGIKKVIDNPWSIVISLMSKKPFRKLPDDIYLKIIYFSKFQQKLNLSKPKTFNEKLQWLKLYDRNPLYTQLVDKYKVRDYVTKKIGTDYQIPLLGVWENADEIDWESLPNQFVIKCTHDSGGLIICTDKTRLDIYYAKEKINQSLSNNFYNFYREWPYKNVKPRIIAERYIEDNKELKDYRFFCFNGEPKFIAVDFSITDKSKTRRNIYDLDWNLLPIEISYPRELNQVVEKPDKIEEMIELSKKLSENIPHVRVDFYYIKNQIIFGEMTFFHQSGFGDIRPKKVAHEIGSWIDLSVFDIDLNTK